MVVHSFDRFYVVTKFILPTIGELMFSKLDLITLVHTWTINMLRILNQGNIYLT